MDCFALIIRLSTRLRYLRWAPRAAARSVHPQSL